MMAVLICLPWSEKFDLVFRNLIRSNYSPRVHWAYTTDRPEKRVVQLGSEFATNDGALELLVGLRVHHTLLALEALVDSNLTVMAFESTAEWSTKVCLSTGKVVHHHCLMGRGNNASRSSINSSQLITKSVLI